MSDSLRFREISDPAVMAIQPLVSVIMLAYRHERFIAQAIESVVSQVCDFPFELIIAEDCSPDTTLEIALDYQRRYPNIIRVLTWDQNVGMHANSRRRLSTMRGKYMAHCEGDDYWNHPRKLQMQVDLFSANPDMVACHTDYDRERRFGTSRSKHKHRKNVDTWIAQGNTYRGLLSEWSVMTATTMFDRDTYLAFRQSEYCNPKWPFGDYNLVLFASLRGKIGYINESTATYRKTGGSSTNGDYASRLRMILATEECVDFFMSRHPIESALEQKIRAQLKKRIYRTAFYAERVDLLETTYLWLSNNGYQKNALLHRIRMAVIACKFPVPAIRAIKSFVSRHLKSIST